MTLTVHTLTTRTRKHCRVERKQQKVGFAIRLTILQNVSLQKTSPRTFNSTKMYAATSEDSLYTSPEFSLVFLTENIAKRQPLHRISVHCPPP